MTYLVAPEGAIPKPIKIHWAELSADQSYTSSTVCAFDTLVSSSSSTAIALSSNEFTLSKGEWVIQGVVAVERTDTTTSYQVQFRDATTSTELVEADGWMDGQSVTADVAASLVFQARVILDAPVTFELFVNGSAGAIKADGTHMIIMEMDT